MSFDAAKGLLYCGDVGEAAREEINVIVKGGNYGWPIREGAFPGPHFGPANAQMNFVDPIFEYEHGSTNSLQAAAVVGGLTYYGDRLSQIHGHYLFADHVDGGIWAFRNDGNRVVGERRLTAEPGISAFGIDPSNGDVLLVMYYSGIIKRLTYSSTVLGAPLPRTLADTGAFENLETLVTSPGIVPYDITIPFWSDRAGKRRWFSLPNVNTTISAAQDGKWQFPAGMVWIKHLN
jgi:hypothetical protein